MRPIKFRAWDKEKEKMVMPDDAWYGVQIYLNGDCEPYDKARGYGECGTYKFPGEFELMQYTGLKDKNGKEIYEGDVVRFKETNYIIEWDNERVCFTGTNKEESKISEVIGNIYENPELLQTKEG